VIGLGLRNPRKKERKKERDRKKERKEKWLIGCSPFALSPVIRLGLQNPRKKEKKKGGKRSSAFEPGASGLPYYCTLIVCVFDVIGTLAVW